MLKSCCRDYGDGRSCLHQRPSVCNRAQWQSGQNSESMELGGSRCGAGVDADEKLVVAVEGVTCLLGRPREMIPTDPFAALDRCCLSGFLVAVALASVVSVVSAVSDVADRADMSPGRRAPSLRLGWAPIANGLHVKTSPKTFVSVSGRLRCRLCRHR